MKNTKIYFSQKLVREGNRLWNYIETFHNICKTLHSQDTMAEMTLPITLWCLRWVSQWEKGLFPHLLLNGKSELIKWLILKISLDHMSFINQRHLIKAVICYEERVKIPLSQVNKFDIGSIYEKNNWNTTFHKKNNLFLLSMNKNNWHIRTNYGKSQ
jgi:hypothetical protein